MSAWLAVRKNKGWGKWGDSPATKTRWLLAGGFSLFYKLSKGMRVKCDASQRQNFMRGEIVVYQLSETKYKREMWTKYDESIKEKGKI